MAAIDKTMLPDSLLATPQQLGQLQAQAAHSQQLGNHAQIQPQAAHLTPKTSTNFNSGVFGDLNVTTFMVKVEMDLKKENARLNEQCRVLKQANAVLQAQLDSTRGADTESEKRISELQADLLRATDSYERRISELEAQIGARKRPHTGGKTMAGVMNTAVTVHMKAQEAAAAAAAAATETDDADESHPRTGGKTMAGVMNTAATILMQAQEEIAAKEARACVGNKHLYGCPAPRDESSDDESSDEESSYEESSEILQPFQEDYNEAGGFEQQAADLENFQVRDLEYFRQQVALDFVFPEILVDEELPASKSRRTCEPVEFVDEVEELHNIHEDVVVDLGDHYELQQLALSAIKDKYEDYSAHVRIATKLANNNMPIKNGSKKTRGEMPGWTSNAKVARVLVEGVDLELREMLADNGVEAIAGSSRMPTSGARVKVDDRACIVLVDSLDDGTPDMQDVVLQHAAMNLVLSGHPVMTLRRFVEELAAFNVVNQVYGAGAPRDLRADFFARLKGAPNALYHWVTPAKPCMFRICTANSDEKQLMDLLCRNLATKSGVSLVQHSSGSGCAKTPAEICAMVGKQFVAY